jgi:predicted ester cyclase
LTVSEILGKAKQFFEACEAGKGWDVCRAFCHDGATFSCQAGALGEVDTLEGYTEWVKNLFIPIPDSHYDLRFFAADDERGTVAAYSVFKGTQTGPGGPGEPTGKSVSTDYVYAMEFEDGRIRHITKIWNDATALQQLGWM